MRINHDTQMKDFEKPVLSTGITHTQKALEKKGLKAHTPQV